MSEENLARAGSAEARLRSFVNDLMRLSLSGHSLGDITAEFENFYPEYARQCPASSVFALRRFDDLKISLFSNVMSDEEKIKLYERYESHGFDNPTAKLFALIFLHRSMSDGPIQERFKRELTALIDTELGRGTIDETIAGMPEVAGRIKQWRANPSSTPHAGE